MHAFIAGSALMRGMVSIAGGFLYWGMRTRGVPRLLDGDCVLVFWSASTHTRRADEAARAHRANL